MSTEPKKENEPQAKRPRIEAPKVEDGSGDVAVSLFIYKTYIILLFIACRSC